MDRRVRVAAAPRPRRTARVRCPHAKHRRHTRAVVRRPVRRRRPGAGGGVCRRIARRCRLPFQPERRSPAQPSHRGLPTAWSARARSHSWRSSDGVPRRCVVCGERHRPDARHALLFHRRGRRARDSYPCERDDRDLGVRPARRGCRGCAGRHCSTPARPSGESECNGPRHRRSERDLWSSAGRADRRCPSEGSWSTSAG